MVVCAQNWIALGHTYPWCTHDDTHSRYIGIALPGEPTGLICVDDDVECDDYPD